MKLHVVVADLTAILMYQYVLSKINQSVPIIRIGGALEDAGVLVDAGV